jgi:uncharacterized protein YraI
VLPSSARSISSSTVNVGINQGRIVPGGSQVWLYDGRAGERLTLTTQASWDTTLALYLNDYSGTNSRIQHVLPSNGTYKIVVAGYSSSDSGSYTLSIESDAYTTANNSTNHILGVIDTGRLNIRSGPGINYTQVSRISYGDIVRVIGRDTIGRWVEIEAPSVGVRGWVNSRYVRINEDILTLPVNFDMPSSSSPASFAGTVITAEVSSDELNIRSGPGTDNSILNTLRRGDRVVLIGRNGSASWVQVSGYNNGWVNSQFLTFGEDLMTLPCTTSGMNLGTAEVTSSGRTRNNLVTSSVNERTQAAYQAFQYGHMIWLRSTDTIYVMFQDGRWEQFVDLFEEGMVEIDPNIVAPQGFVQPRRGFGLVWRRYRHVRNALGWGLHTEIGYTAQHSYSSINGERNITIPGSQRFILYSSGRWTR